MKLTQIAITNFRCFESLRVPLQPDVNVFVVVNASGKTAILDAIAIALYDIVDSNGGGGEREPLAKIERMGVDSIVDANDSRGSERQRALQGVNLRPSDIHMRPGAEEPVSGREGFVQIRTQAGS